MFGDVGRFDDLAVEGSLAERDLVAYYGERGRLRGALTIREYLTLRDAGIHTVGDLAKRLNATGLPWPTVAERGGVEPAAFKRLLEGAPERRLSRPEKRLVRRLFPAPVPTAAAAAGEGLRARGRAWGA